MSGIATLTAQYVAAVAGTKARIVDTRKHIEAVLAAGADTILLDNFTTAMEAFKQTSLRLAVLCFPTISLGNCRFSLTSRSHRS
jgi:nicotinate-nucleotide pyrophosphorylase